MQHWNKPQATEHPESYTRYIEKVPQGNLITQLSTQLNETISFLKTIPKEKFNYRYAEGKWTIKQIIQHLSDCERVFCYRALRFARNDNTALAGFEENDYANEANTELRSIEQLLEEFSAIRQSTLCLVKSFSDEELKRKGIANNKSISVNALCYIIAGHELHHASIIKERYL